MAPLVKLVLSARRAVRAAIPLALTMVLGGLVALDAASAIPMPWAAGAAALLAGLVLTRVVRRMKAIEGSLLVDLELGLALLVGAHAVVVRLDGSLDGASYPLVYAVVALVSAFARPAVTVLLVLALGGLEVCIRHVVGGTIEPASLTLHVGFATAFATLSAIALRAEITRVRRASRSHLEAEIERLRDDARSYRLLAAPTTTRAAARPSDDERLARSGVEEIHQSVLFALRLLRESLGLYTAMLLWRNDSGTHLRISELASDAQNVSEGPFLAGDGVFGAAIAQGSAVCIEDLKPGYHLPYYVGGCPVRAVCALPVFEHGALRGVLVVDRATEQPFSPREQELIEEASRYAVRAIQNERVFAQLERAKVEQGKLYRAAETLGAATTESDVIDAGVKSAREITSVDYAAVTLFDDATKTHEIRAVSGDGADDVVGQRFRHNTGLVSMVLQNRHPLPYRGEYDEKRQVVFTRRLAPPAMPSIVVLPLLVHDRPLGTLVLGSRRRAAFTDAARSTLEVLASHMAVSLANARMVRRLEELATTDGLSGLLNKRALLEVAGQKIAASRRFGRQLSVLIVDIDWFKKVNDTYGHDVGDVVIKGLGEILRRAKRTTDAVARFGGEEFVIICEETDARGAMLLAERVREELGHTVFHPPASSKDAGAAPVEVQVTCSLGVATFPEAGETWEELFKASDDALYLSKRSGRDRSTAWSPSMRGHGHDAPANPRLAPLAEPSEPSRAASMRSPMTIRSAQPAVPPGWRGATPAPGASKDKASSAA